MKDWCQMFSAIIHKSPTRCFCLASLALGLSWFVSGCGQAGSDAQESLIVLANAEPTLPEQISYNRDIRPILSDKCFACHGPDKAAREAELRLDQPEDGENFFGALSVIMPRDPKVSELVKRIHTSKSKLMMPPPKTKVSLNSKEKRLLERWIEQGAEYEPHWSFVAPTQAELPGVKQVGWVKNEIDRFVLARLEGDGLKPAPALNKRMLIRRATLDLTGLPPTPEEVAAFTNDNSKDAYETVVDRLLASPQYGEHMTRYWLDAVRFADTHGLHLDNYREMYPYRDWVIRSFNQNMPFDQFTTEQLAGDLLETPTLDQQIASGFNRCHVTTNEGGSIKEEVQVRNVIDRVETAGTIWLGMTAGCAVCHDHKYDPISQKEFYELYAFFNSFDGNAMDGNNAKHAPVVRVPSETTKQQLAELDERLKEFDAKIKARKAEAEPDFIAWLGSEEIKRQNGQVDKPEAVSKGLIIHCPLDENKGNTILNKVAPDAGGKVYGQSRWTPGVTGSGFTFAGGDRIELGKDEANFEQDQAFSYGCWIKTPGSTTGAAIAKMDESNSHRGWDLYINNRKVAMHLIHSWPGNTLKVTTKADVLKPNEWHHVFITYDGSKKAAGVKVYVDGKPQPFNVSHNTLNGTTKTGVPLTLGRRTSGGPLNGCSIDDVRIYDRALAVQDIATLKQDDAVEVLLRTPADKRTDQQTETIRQYYLNNIEKVYPALLKERSDAKQQRDKTFDAAPTSLVYRETKQPRKAFLLDRGEYDKREDEVQRGVPGFLPPLTEEQPRNRLGLAQWLMSPGHPLTARVTVNRFWQQLFGTGLVKTSEDFGMQGEMPSHPQMLDWLAVQFIKDGWDVKKTMKRMVMSATYQQSAAVSSEQYQNDPDNRLLARGPRLRLDAEVLRDQALATSGLLNSEIGGASVKPPQPGGIWRAVGYESSNTARFKADVGDKVYRRSMYTFWKRTAPPPFMSVLDAPNRESCVVKRERTNTPMQALLVLNEPQYVESARRLGERVMNESKAAPKQRIAWLVERTLIREPTDQERSILIDGYNEQLAYYRADVDAAKALIAIGTSKPDASLDPAELAAWTMTASTLINLDEFINKP